MLFLAVLASGNGSNLQAISHAIENQELHARIQLVLSNNSQAGALSFAREQGIPAVHLSTKVIPQENQFIQSMLSVFSEHNVNFIALAGYMKLVPPEVVREYRNRITNIHPALLPKFGGAGMYGMRVHEAVIGSGETESGATVHLVDEAYDRGPIVLQRRVAVSPADTPDSLQKKVLQVEHQLYPEALQLFAAERVVIENTTLSILPAAHSS